MITIHATRLSGRVSKAANRGQNEPMFNISCSFSVKVTYDSLV